MAYISLYNIPTFLKDPDLVAYYRFEDSLKNEVGTTGDTFSGVTFSNASGISGCGKYAHFTSGNYATLDKSINLVNEPNITVMCWIKVTSGTTNTQTFISMSYDGFFVQSYLGIDPNGTSTKVIFGQYQPDVTAWKNAVSNSALTNNVWTHVAGTYNQTTWRLYINGTLQTTTAADTRVLRPCNRPYTLGKSGAPWGNNYLVGDMDEACILKRRLSDADIAAVVAGTYTPPTFALATTQNKLGPSIRRTRVTGSLSGL